MSGETKVLGHPEWALYRVGPASDEASVKAEYVLRDPDGAEIDRASGVYSAARLISRHEASGKWGFESRWNDILLAEGRLRRAS